MSIPWYIWKEIISYIPVDRLAELRRVNKAWFAAASPPFLTYLEYNDAGRFTPELRTNLSSLKHLKTVTMIRLSHFDSVGGNLLSGFCPSVQHLTLEDPICADLPLDDHFFRFYQGLSLLKHLLINIELPYSSLIRLSPKVKTLNSLNFSAKSLSQAELLDLIKAFSSESLSVLCITDMQASKEVPGCVSESFPRLLEYRSSVTDADAGVSSIRNFLPTARVKKARIALSTDGDVRSSELDLSGFQKLKALIVVAKRHHLSIAMRCYTQEYPQIKSLSLLCHQISFLKQLAAMFPGLDALSICCKRIQPKDFNQFLSTLFQIKHLSLYVYERPEVVFSLPFQAYAITKLALNFKCPVTSELFIWISNCLPHLEELSLLSLNVFSIEESFMNLSLPLDHLFRFVSTQELSLRFWRAFVPSAKNLTFVHLKTSSKNNSRDLGASFPHISVSESKDVSGLVVSPLI